MSWARFPLPAAYNFISGSYHLAQFQLLSNSCPPPPPPGKTLLPDLYCSFPTLHYTEWHQPLNLFIRTQVYNIQPHASVVESQHPRGRARGLQKSQPSGGPSEPNWFFNTSHSQSHSPDGQPQTLWGSAFASGNLIPTCLAFAWDTSSIFKN